MSLASPAQAPPHPWSSPTGSSQDAIPKTSNASLNCLAAMKTIFTHCFSHCNGGLYFPSSAWFPIAPRKSFLIEKIIENPLYSENRYFDSGYCRCVWRWEWEGDVKLKGSILKKKKGKREGEASGARQRNRKIGQSNEACNNEIGFRLALVSKRPLLNP